jgi:hypothetical protein
MKKLVKGDFSGAWDSMVDAAKILADSPVAKGVTKSLSVWLIKQSMLPGNTCRNGWG